VAGLTVAAAPRRIAAIDPDARVAVHLPPGATPDLRDRIEEWSSSL
jgi:hypothetical protein